MPAKKTVKPKLPIGMPDLAPLISAAILNALTASKPQSSGDSLKAAVSVGAVQLDKNGFPIVRFDVGPKPVSVKLVLGMRQRMMYALSLWDDAGHKKAAHEGVSWDHEPDEHSFPADAALDEDHLFWDVKITQTATGSGDFYYLALHFEQDGAALCPPFEYFGPLTGTAIVSGSLVFKA
jgi:hypothetical protein